jgi:hypothetical protein
MFGRCLGGRQAQYCPFVAQLTILIFGPLVST